MSDNQYVFEIIRDVGYMIQDIKARETVWFHVTNDDGNFFTARSSKGVPRGGLSETSRAIKEAYKVTRGVPDQRDIKIEQLEHRMKEMYGHMQMCINTGETNYPEKFDEWFDNN